MSALPENLLFRIPGQAIFDTCFVQTSQSRIQCIGRNDHRVVRCMEDPHRQLLQSTDSFGISSTCDRNQSCKCIRMLHSHYISPKCSGRDSCKIEPLIIYAIIFHKLLYQFPCHLELRHRPERRICSLTNELIKGCPVIILVIANITLGY